MAKKAGAEAEAKEGVLVGIGSNERLMSHDLIMVKRLKRPKGLKRLKRRKG